MTSTLNGHKFVDHSNRGKPRNYEDQILLSREFKKEILHHLTGLSNEWRYAKYAKKMREKYEKEEYQYFCPDGQRGNNLVNLDGGLG